jgi:outer membrane protein assembly factor BamA
MRTTSLSRTVLLLALAPAASAPATAQQPPPRFLIESFVVEGLEAAAARDIVVAETLLTTGREYDENQLKEALYRVKRLPFVLDAELALRKGSERGTYTLVIQVSANKPFFHSTFLGVVVERDDEPDGSDRVDWTAESHVGVRRFVGTWGLLHASAFAAEGLHTTPVQVGYTRYNLFGRGAFASFAISGAALGENDHDQFGASLELGLPLSRRQSLRSVLLWNRVESTFRLLDGQGQTGVVDSRIDEQTAALSWVYDTTDHPVFASRGAKVTAVADYSRVRREQRGGPAGFPLANATNEAYRVALVARRYFPLTPRNTVSVGGDASWQRFAGASLPGPSHGTRAAVGARHSLRLWDYSRTRRLGDLRLETEVELDHTRFGSSDGTLLTLRSLIVHRNPWGFVQGGLLYFDSLRRR